VAAEKYKFELKANLSSPTVQVARPDGSEVTLQEDAVFETTDGELARDLMQIDAVKEASKGAK
jgi:hypothetical protein